MGFGLTVPRRAKQGDRFPFVSAIDTEIVLVHRDYGVSWIKLAHPNQTDISEVGLTLPVAFREFRQLLDIPMAVERDPQHFVLQ